MHLKNPGFSNKSNTFLIKLNEDPYNCLENSGLNCNDSSCEPHLTFAPYVLRIDHLFLKEKGGKL